MTYAQHALSSKSQELYSSGSFLYSHQACCLLRGFSFGILVITYAVIAYMHMVVIMLVYVYKFTYMTSLYIVVGISHWIHLIFIVLFLFCLQEYTLTLHVVILRFTSDLCYLHVINLQNLKRFSKIFVIHLYFDILFVLSRKREI